LQEHPGHERVGGTNAEHEEMRALGVPLERITSRTPIGHMLRFEVQQIDFGFLFSAASDTHQRADFTDSITLVK
jgi:hypothetical protein